MEYRKDGVSLRFSQDVVYYLDGKTVRLPVAGDFARDNQIEVYVSSSQDHGLNMQMRVRNIGSVPLVLREMNYVTIKEQKDFSICGKSLAECMVYRQGRHKNDIPSVFCPGVMDERLEDAAGGMLETGDKDEAGRESVVHSDSLTVIHADGMNLMFGFLTGRDSFVDCAIQTGASQGMVCGCSPINVVLHPGKAFEGEVLLIQTGNQENRLIEAYAERKAAIYGARRQKKAPAVFCTWYYYGLTVTYEDVAENLAQIKEKNLPFDVFQVDEGWEVTLGEWEPNRKFPIAMKEVAQEIKEAGMTAGIWTSPFIAHETASVWKSHPQWILKDREGNPCLFHMNDTVYQVFDITNPEVYPYFTQLYRKLTFDWGYTYHKLDFTRAAVIYEQGDFYDKTLSLPQAYYRAVAAIREGMGEDAYFLMCGGLYDPIIGLVDGQRMGADVLSMWRSDINRDGKALPFTVKQNLLRYYMNRWWNNDPDALMVRRQTKMERGLRLTLGLLDDEEVKTAVVNQYMGGGLMCSTEPLKTIDEDRLNQLKHILPVMERKVEVRPFLGEERFPGMVDILVKEKGWHNLVLINWDDENQIPAELVLTDEVVFDWLAQGAGEKTRQETEQEGIEKAGQMPAASSWLVAEFYSGQYLTDVKPGQTVCMGTVRPHGSAVFKIQPYDSRESYIVKSDAHYSMGGEVDVLEVEQGELVFKMNSLFETAGTYTILLPAGYTTKDGKREVEITVQGRGPRQVRISIEGSTDSMEDGGCYGTR